MKEFQRNLNTTVIHNSKTDLGGNSNSNLLIFNVIVIATYYIDLGSNCNSNGNILILKVIVIIIIIREYGSTLYVHCKNEFVILTDQLLPQLHLHFQYIVRNMNTRIISILSGYNIFLW